MAVIPPNYVDVLAALRSRGHVNVCGIVVDTMSPFKTAKSTFCVTFTVKDCDLDNGHIWDGLKVKYFGENENYLPPVRVKDVILLRNLYIKLWNGRCMGVASEYDKPPWAVFRSESDPTSTLAPMTGPRPFDASYAEKQYAQFLLRRVSSDTTIQGKVPLQMATSNVVQASVSKATAAGHWPTPLIQDLQERTYVDLMVEVVKVHKNDFEKTILYVTDYTTHQDLVDYSKKEDKGREGDEYGYLSRHLKTWPGPFGKMTLQITLWEPHASYAREHFEARSLVHLTNVHIKRGRVAGNLEASLHGDRLYPDKIHVKAVHDKNDYRIRGLLQRKSEYWNENGGVPEGPDGKGTSKKSKKKQRKKQEANKQEDQMPLSTKAAPVKAKQPNNLVQAINPEIPCRSLEDIIHNESHHNTSPDNIEYRLPFQNICYRAIVRVVDYFPHNLEDFAVALNSESTIFSDSISENPSSNEPVIWEWRFCLLLESSTPPPPGQPRERIKLFVSGLDAEYLLKIDAVDLRKDKERFEELKYKLSILWGDLQERKDKAAAEGEPNSQPLSAVSSRPFVCCIKEYGVECSHRLDPDRMQTGDDVDSECGVDGCFGWERRFAMFETVIHS